MYLVTWVILLISFCICNVLLKLWVVLELNWDLLNWQLAIICIYLIRVSFLLLTIILWLLVGDAWVSSLQRFSTLVFRLFSTHNWSLILSSIFFFHLLIQGFSLFKYFHQFGIYFITIQLFQNVFLVIKLILWLFCLLCSLLCLYNTKSILRFLFLLFNVLSMTLGSIFLYLVSLVLHLTISLFLVKFFIRSFGKLIFIVNDMHRQALIWKTLVCWVSAITLILLIILL